MLKKIFKALTASILLMGCYLGYVRAFAVVVEQFRATRRIDVNAFVRTDSKSMLEAIELAKRHFGSGHWSAAEDLMFRYYNSERRFWMYAQEVVRVIEQDGVKYDGKRVTMAPFALVTLSADGKSAKTVLSDRAVFDLNEPLSMNVNANGKPLKINHAWIQGNVLIRDNHGTPQESGDDMIIGPLTAVEYDEPTLQIRSESDVVIQDRDMRITGLGMLIQLRSPDETSHPSGSSTGFQGAKTLYLLKNVDVLMRDVGKSGILPGSVQPKRTASGDAIAANGPNSTRDALAAKDEPKPTPLHVHCDSTMRVDLAEPQAPVPVGPPERPSPTLAQFDRNVVVLRGPAESLRDQLTCDTLKLTLVPDDKSAVGTKPDVNSKSQPQASVDEDKGPLGDLTLQRAHATGHAVWLYLPAQGIKLRCNELIHNRLRPFKPDETYFRGDATRPIDLTKIDAVQEEGPDQGKVTSVTNIRTVDATMFDRGYGLDTANVIARGPGKLETRPDRDQPVERIAIWQKQLEIQNQLGPDDRLKQKLIVLAGSRPCFIDAQKKTSLDSASTIWIWLKPKPGTAQQAGASATTPVGPAGTVASIAMSSDRGNSAASTQAKPSNTGDANADLGGGSLQIERLLAFRDVHLLAPAKTLTARERLDAEFVDAEPIAVASAPTTEPKTATSPAFTNADPSAGQGQDQDPKPAEKPKEDAVAAQNPDQTEPSDPPMTGSAERVWAKIAQSPGSNLGAGSNKRATATKTAASNSKAKSNASEPGSNAEVRKVWMFGNVALHQDPAPGKTKGQDASGEAVYLDNRGKDKALTVVYQYDPSEKTRRPGPMPRARVENEDNKISVAGLITFNQETDQASATGAGTMTQLAARGFLTDQAPDDTANADDANPSKTPADVVVKSKPRPKKRAGVALTEKAPMTITFSDRMEFNGRSVDPEGRPSARADFYGTVSAKMEDALLYCEEQMITFTDKQIRLAQLGAMSKGQSKPRADRDGLDQANEEADAEAPAKAELSRIYCFKNAWGMNRKVDPDRPILLQKQKIYAYDNLVYDHLTGDFEIPGKGVVWLVDRDKKSGENSGQNSTGDSDAEIDSNGLPLDRTATGRTVTPTSGRATRPPNRTGSAAATATRSRVTARPTPAVNSKTADVPPLVLTQIQFVKGMRGQFGSSKTENKARRGGRFSSVISRSAGHRCRAMKAGSTPIDSPRDGFFLTGQTLRVLTEPPPPSAPPSTPARNYLKAWDRAHVTSVDKTLDADVITYDTYKNLFYAYGEQGRRVNFADQHAPGQAPSLGSGKAVQFNPKTGNANVIDSDKMSLIDKKTGIRPTTELAPDPNAKPKKPFKKPYRTPPTNVDRRNFTGS